MNADAQITTHKERIQRVTRMEETFDRGVIAIENLTSACQEYMSVQAALTELENYYEDGQWLSDYFAEREHVFPDDMKRGILTEDAIYDPLTTKDTMTRLLKELCKNM